MDDDKTEPPKSVLWDHKACGQPDRFNVTWEHKKIVASTVYVAITLLCCELIYFFLFVYSELVLYYLDSDE